MSASRVLATLGLPCLERCIAYGVGSASTLYLSVTNDLGPCGVSLAKTRGPSFVSPAGPIIGDEPTATELVEVVDAFYIARDELGSMGELDGGVVFQGEGEPLLRLPVILDTIRRVAEKRNGIPFRINTSGLVSCDEDIASLVAAMH